MTKPNETTHAPTTRVRIFKSALNGVTYKYGLPLEATRENMRKVQSGEL